MYGKVSETRPIDLGVPQRGVLGPLVHLQQMITLCKED